MNDDDSEKQSQRVSSLGGKKTILRKDKQGGDVISPSRLNVTLTSSNPNFGKKQVRITCGLTLLVDAGYQSDRNFCLFCSYEEGTYR